MKDRIAMDAALDHLAVMLPPWLARARCDAQFWPHFNVLVDEILAGASEPDRTHAVRRIETMLARNGRRRPAPE